LYWLQQQQVAWHSVSANVAKNKENDNQIALVVFVNVVHIREQENASSNGNLSFFICEIRFLKFCQRNLCSSLNFLIFVVVGCVDIVLAYFV